jgi:hypothetical protein
MEPGLAYRVSDQEPILRSWQSSAVKIYSAASSLVRFENKNISSTLKNVLAYYNADVVNYVRSHRIGPSIKVVCFWQIWLCSFHFYQLLFQVLFSFFIFGFKIFEQHAFFMQIDLVHMDVSSFMMQ